MTLLLGSECDEIIVRCEDYFSSGRGEGTLKVDNSGIPSNSERVCECDVEENFVGP